MNFLSLSYYTLSLGIVSLSILGLSILGLSGCTQLGNLRTKSTEHSTASGYNPLSQAEILNARLPITVSNDPPKKVSTALPQAASQEEGRKASQSAKSDLPDISPERKVPVRQIPLSLFTAFPVHQGEINALAVSRDGARAYTGGNDGRVICSTIIKPDSKNMQAPALGSVGISTLLTSSRPILALALSPDERFLAVAQYSSVVIFDIGQKQIVNYLTRVSGRLLAVAFDPRGELVAVGRASGETFIWNLKSGKAPGRDSLDAIEQYGNADGSPIKKLGFHPSGRAFIAAGEDGNITIWRLLRTEAELGLRDSSALIDDDNKGSKDIPVGKIPSHVEDFQLNTERGEVLVSGADGNLYGWKLRGLEALPSVSLGVDATTSVQDISSSNLFENKNYLTEAERVSKYFVSTGRGQKIKFWCERTADSLDISDKTTRKAVVVSGDKSNFSSGSSNGPEIIGGRLVLDSVVEDKTRSDTKTIVNQSAAQLIAESDFFKDPIHILRISSSSPVLWAAQKKGNLLTFDVREVAKSGNYSPETLANCRFQ